MQEIQETQVRSLGWEDPLECGMATHFSMLAWKIPWTEEPGGQLFPGSQRVGHDWAAFTFFTDWATREAHEDISCVVLERTHKTSFYLNYLGKSPISKYSHILSYTWSEVINIQIQWGHNSACGYTDSYTIQVVYERAQHTRCSVNVDSSHCPFNLSYVTQKYSPLR